mmetsp:Transcript_69917/g.166907  ORF Transcript_69917/g.166907 Transcript_69917/m.166907 type:complete len:83 (-) Transcript_69917:622-870(-)
MPRSTRQQAHRFASENGSAHLGPKPAGAGAGAGDGAASCIFLWSNGPTASPTLARPFQATSVFPLAFGPAEGFSGAVSVSMR